MVDNKPDPTMEKNAEKIINNETRPSNNFDNSQGNNSSGGTMSVVSRTTGKQKKSTEEISDRKKIKVLKQALKDERAK